VQDVNCTVNEFGKKQDMMKKMRGDGLMKKLGGMKGMQVGYKTQLNL